MPHRYPDNWAEIAHRQKQAADWRCQQCRKLCRMPRESLSRFIERTGYAAEPVQAHPQRWTLTVSHPDHDPENPEARLVALCVPCHRAYDNPQMATIKQKKRESAGQLRLDQAGPVALEGVQLALGDLGQPQPVANVQPGVERVTVATLVAWLHEHVGQAAVDPIAYLRQLQPGTANQAESLANLNESVPYRGRFQPDDLQAACVQVFNTWTAPRPQTRYSRVRRHTEKGHASGWIEERQGNRRRKTPSVSHYYLWDSPRGRVCEYIRADRVARVDAMVRSRRPAVEVLQCVMEGRKVTGVAARVLGAEQPDSQLLTCLEKSN